MWPTQCKHTHTHTQCCIPAPLSTDEPSLPQSATSFLQYLDVSVGKEVSATCTKTGRLDVMCQNPHNAIVHLGHSNGTVTLWSPNQKEALAKMLCHQGAVRSVAVDKTGM